MSMMSTSVPRSSVFTFESTVHSCHVLRCLDEQRRRDTLCDVTVVVEGQSFRAHRSVLASCSEYFTHRLSSLTQHGEVISLPHEVTVAGFEPLLKFAYTSKLLIERDNVLEIRNSASVLGFRDLDESCFDFLLPALFSSSKGSVPRKTCCKKKSKRRLSNEDCAADSIDVLLDEKEAKPVADSSSLQEMAWPCNKSVNNKMGSLNSTGALTSLAEGSRDHFNQCPKYRKFQLAYGKETCVQERSLLSCSPCSNSSNSKNETDVEFPENSASHSTRLREAVAEDGGGREEADMVEKDTNEMQTTWSEEREMDVVKDIGSPDRSTVKAIASGTSAVLGERSLGYLNYCPLKTFGEGPAITKSLGHKKLVMDNTENTRNSGAPASVYQKEEEWEGDERKRDHQADSGRLERGQTCMERAPLSENNAKERSTMETKVAEQKAMRLVSDVASSQLNLQDPDAGSSSDTGSGRAQSTASHNVTSQSTSCPFFQDLDQIKSLWKRAELSECEGASQSGVSSLNSGEDGDSETETEGDSESYARERARQVQLPFSVEWIVDLSRNDFQQMLKQQVFTHEQLEFVHDMRRRSKNRLAAQRCRKRKLECINNLQREINKLKTEREKLMTEKSQLSQMKSKTHHSVSALFQRVCNEANLQPEQLQVLAKYTSLDCPLSSLCPHMDSLLPQPGWLLQPHASLSALFEGLGEASSSPGGDTVTGDRQHSL